MAINFKKILLAGTALVAVSAVSTQAQAIVAFAHTPASIAAATNGTWAETTNGTAVNATSVDIAHAGQGDNVDLAAGQTLTVTNDNTAADGTAADGNHFTLGAVTNVAGTGTMTVTTGAGGATNTVTIGSASVVTANFTVANTASDALAATISGALTTTGALSVDASSQTNAMAAGDIVTVTGNATIGTTTAIKSANVAGAGNAQLNLNGASNTLTGLVTLTATNANTGSTAILKSTGATNVLTGGVKFADNTGLTYLTLNGATAQTVTGGDLTGAGAGQGTIIVDNAKGVTFGNTVGVGAALKGITINAGAGNSSATFTGATVASPITLGGAASTVGGVTFGTAAVTDINTVTFDSTTNAIAQTGAIAGANATQINNIAVIGGKTVTFNTADTSNLTNLSVTGASTKLTTGANLTIGTMTTIGAGAELDTTGNTFTSPVTVTGTLGMAGGAVTGAVDGSAANTGTLAVTGNGTLTGIIGGTHSLSAITVATGKTLTASANVSATTTTLTGTGALTLSNGASQTVTGNIAAAATGNGTVTISDGAHTTAFVGNIGTSALPVGALTVTDGAGANLVTTTGNVYVNATLLNTADTLQFLGTGADTVSGTIDAGAAGAGNGILTVGDGTTTNAPTVTFKGAIGTTALASSTVGKYATAIFDDNTSFTGALTNGGTVTVNPTTALSKTLTVGSSYTATAGSTLNLGFSNAAGNAVVGNQTSGKLAVTGTTTLTGSTLNFNVLSTSAPLVAGTYASVITSSVASVLPVTMTSSSAIYTFAPVINGTNVDVKVANNLANVTTTASNTNVGNTLLAINTVTGLTASDTGQIALVQGQLVSSSTTTVNNILSAAAPTLDGSSTATALSVGSQVMGVADTRLASLRSGDGLTGMAAGSSANGVSMWLQGYGQSAVQSQRSGVAGYDSDTLGAAIGVDTTQMMNSGVLGVAFNYGRTNATSKNSNATKTNLDNYGIGLYGSYDLGSQMFLNGQAGYAYNKISDDRYNVGGVAGLTAHGSYHSDQYSAKLALGRDYGMEHGLVLTPTVSADYVYLSNSSYTETGAGGADLVVGSNNVDAVDLGLGLNAAWKMKNSNGDMMTPSLHGGYSYNATDSKLQTTSSFTGDKLATAFTTSGPTPARSKFDLGAGIVYATTANWDLSANYDYTFQEAYHAHNGMLRATSHF